MPQNNILLVDLDKTLIKTDLLWDQLFQLIRRHPRKIASLPLWIFQGRVYLKNQLVQYTDIDPKFLPYNQDVLELIHLEKKKGVSAILVSASHESLVKKIAHHLGLFEEAVGTKNSNLKGRNKTKLIREKFGNRPFMYVGDSWCDIDLWSHSANSFVVNPSFFTLRRLQFLKIPFTLLGPPPNSWRALLKAIRCHQWSKNLLIFIPLLAAHSFFNPTTWIQSLSAFFAYSFTASALYIFNDLLDMGSDRQHALKKHRPFASGDLNVTTGLLTSALLILFAIGASAVLPRSFAYCLGIYIVCNALYSLRFKQIEILDVMTLATLYTLRILSGGYATSIPVSPWLLAFSTFFFYGLALVKRYTEIKRTKEGERLPGRGYNVADREAIFALGVCSSFCAMLILVLYLNSVAVTNLYRNPDFLWFLTPVLFFWISRVWLLAHRDEIHDDPIVFAIQDKVTWFASLLFLGVVFISI